MPARGSVEGGLGILGRVSRGQERGGDSRIFGDTGSDTRGSSVKEEYDDSPPAAGSRTFRLSISFPLMRRKMLSFVLASWLTGCQAARAYFVRMSSISSGCWASE